MSTIAAGTTSTTALVSTGDTTGKLVLQTNGTTTAMTIDTSQNVGIGTSSPSFKLDVSGGTIQNAGTNGLLRLMNGNTSGGVKIGAYTSAGSANGYLAFEGYDAEYARFTADKYFRMASGSGGIQFGGDTAAANALDDYEEGTWTPTYIGSSTAGTTTFASRAGVYTKIGNKVFCECELNWSSTTGTGDGIIGGLPFTVGPYSPDSRSLFYIAAYSGYTITGNLAGIVMSNGDTIILYAINNGSLAGSSIKSAGVMRLQFAYTAA